MKLTVGVLSVLVSLTSWAAIPKVQMGAPTLKSRPIIQQLPCQTAMGIYNECHYSSLGLVSLTIEGTQGDCRFNSTYGIRDTHVWVKGSCKVVFRLSRLL